MSLGYVLFWMSAMTVGAGLFREVRFRRRERAGWLAKYLLLSLVGPTVAFVAGLGIEVAGHVWAMTVFVLLIGPGIGLTRLERLAIDGRWSAARRLASTVRFLHPFDGYWQLPKLYRALEQDDGSPEAQRRFVEVERSPRWGARARIYRLRRHEDWEKILELPTPNPASTVDSLPLLARLRALGECGRRIEVLDLAENATEPRSTILFALRHAVLLYAFAYYGDGVSVQRLLVGPLRSWPRWLKDFWLLTAGLNAGGSAEMTARQEFASLRFEAHREGIGALERRRRAPPSVPPTEDERRRVEALASKLQQETSALPEMYEPGGYRTIPTTTAIAVILVAVFLVEEFLGGSEHLDVAVKMGALVVAPGFEPELWRLGAANFLHFGWVHLFMNVAALFALGPFVEKRLGAFRYLIVLAASGIGSMGLTAYVFYAGREVILVGASGAIMGLVGATAALLLRMRHDDRSGLVGKRLRSVAFILCLQFAFDFLTPKVSLAAHAGGALCGFAAALLIDAMRQPKRR